MKITVFDRILTVLLSLVLLAASVMLIAYATNLISLESIYAAVTLVFGNTSLKPMLIIGAVGALLLIIAIRLIVACCSGKRTPPVPTSVLVRTSEYGMTNITLAAIDSMVQRCCRTMQQIKDCTTSVLPSGSGISVALRLVLMPDVAVPEFSEALQKNVKDTVEGLAGVEVNNVSVLIVEPPKQNVRNASAQ